MSTVCKNMNAYYFSLLLKYGVRQWGVLVPEAFGSKRMRRVGTAVQNCTFISLEYQPKILIWDNFSVSHLILVNEKKQIILCSLVPVLIRRGYQSGAVQEVC
jgi:hypothetical protein